MQLASRLKKNLVIVGLQFTGKLFGFPKDRKEKMINLLEVGANKIMQQ